MTLLEISGMSVQTKNEPPTRILESISLTVDRGEIVGLVGESGSGKSITARSILGLLPLSLEAKSGQVFFQGQDLLRLDERQLREIRGRDISMIFQSPAESMDPLMRIGDQVGEPLVIHKRVSRRTARDSARELLARVHITQPTERAQAYPHQLSGGMLQRASLASALSCQPQLIIADEPTTALDVTIQAQILRLLLEVRQETGAAILLISHDLGVVAEVCDRVVVMYAGRVVEQGAVTDVFAAPAHPYTTALLGATPRLDRAEELLPIPGQPPDPANPPLGCRFQPRCSLAFSRCNVEPPLLKVSPTQVSRCWRVEQ